MKISIAIQYYNRRDLLLTSLSSISNSCLISDTEIIIVDDASDYEHNIDDISSVFPKLNIKLFKFTKEEKWWSCPVIPLNKSISECTGDVVILQGAEIFYMNDIIKHAHDVIKDNDYLVYSCLALTKKGTDDLKNGIISQNKESIEQWYQHSVYRNACYNFCCAIKRKDLLDLGGFDERFAHGISHGDNDFISRIKKKGMNVIQIDNLLTLHQYHQTMQVHPKDGHLCDEVLFNHILKTESGYKIKNSFIYES